MNRSRFVAAALLGLSLLSVDVGRGQLLADGPESIDPQPKSLSTLLDMIGDCAHGAFGRCDLLEQPASAEQTANDADTDGYVGDEVTYDTSAQDESADATTKVRQYRTEEDVTQDDIAQYDGAAVEVARKTGDDYDLADENLPSEDAVNPAFDRAIVPPAPSASTDSNDYSDCQDTAAAPASEEKDFENYDGDWNAESASVPVAAAPVGDESAADEAAADGPVSTEVAAPADYADAYLDESQPATDTRADDVPAVDNNRFDRRALLGVAGLLDRLGIALKTASQELTWLALKDTDNVNQ